MVHPADAWTRLIADEMRLDPADLEDRWSDIVHVARAWERLSQELPREEAVEELRRGLGGEYDPACVGALMWGLAKLTGPQQRESAGARLLARVAARARPDA